MDSKKGLFIIIDGIDGSGKSTILDAWVELLLEKNKKIFDLKDYCKQHLTFPSFAELETYEIIITAEPTHAWIGKAIREEMINSQNDYTASAIAEAYALDRLILYKRLLLPLLNKGKIILQDRSVSTSLCYQSIHSKSLTMDTIAQIEGNAFTLEHAPHHLIIADVPVETAIERLTGRTQKQDQAVFERHEFLDKARKRFLDKAYHHYFTSRGTKIHILDTSKKSDIMVGEGNALLLKLLELNH